MNDPPVFTPPARVLVAENVPAGSLVESFVVVDEDNDPVAFAITAGNVNNTFVVLANGQLQVANPPDFEALSTFSLTVQVTDGRGGFDTELANITITDQPEAPMWTGPRNASVQENSAKGTAVFTARCFDQDFYDRTALQYFITGGNTNQAFAIDQVTGAVTVWTPGMMDFETTPIFNIEVTCTDTTGLIAKSTVTVNLINMAEAPVVLTSKLYVAENSPAGTLTTTALSIFDQDFGDSATVQIIGGNTKANATGNLFNVSGFYIMVNKAALNFEDAANNVFNLTIQVRDAGVGVGGVQTTVATIQIVALDVNEVPVMANTSRIVDENSVVPTPVGSPIVAWDEDAGQSLSFSIVSGNAAGFFRIDSCSGQIKVNALGLDYEQNMTFVLGIQVMDDGSNNPGPARLSTVSYVTITLADKDEPPTLADASVAIRENSPVGTVVVKMNASDPDIYAVNATWRAIVYSLAANPKNLFAIDAVTGVVTVARNALDYESPDGNVYAVLIAVSGVTGMTGARTAALTVSLIDVNEAPVILPQARLTREATLQPLNPVAEGTLLGGPLLASDPDFGQTSQLRFNISAAWPAIAASYFTIDAVTGQLTVSRNGSQNFVLDHETMPIVNLAITALDPGGLTATANCTIDVTDLNGAQPRCGRAASEHTAA